MFHQCGNTTNNDETVCIDTERSTCPPLRLTLKMQMSFELIQLNFHLWGSLEGASLRGENLECCMSAEAHNRRTY